MHYRYYMHVRDSTISIDVVVHGVMAACPTDYHYDLTEWEGWMVLTQKRPGEDQLSKWRWYKGRMNRAVAEEYLAQSLRLDGTFLVRESDAVEVRYDPVYVISVLQGGTTYHVEIETREDRKYALAHIRGARAKAYKTMDKLVSHYQKKPIDLEGGGSVKLKYVLE